MKEGTTFYRCILCSHIVNKWNIKEGGCPNCAGQRIVATNLSLWEKWFKFVYTRVFGGGPMRKEWPKKIQHLFDEMSVVVVSPMFNPEPKWVQSLINAVAYSWNIGLRVWELGTMEKCVIHWARCMLAEIARDAINPLTGKKYSHILWLDVDHVFNRDLICELGKNFLHENVDVVSAIYYSRTGNPFPNIYIKGDAAGEWAHHYLMYFPEGLFECDAFGFGAVMMKREVLERIPIRPFAFVPGVGEDVYFCVNAKKYGIRLWADGSVKMGHIAEPPIIAEKEFTAHMEANKETYKEKLKVLLNTGGK